MIELISHKPVLLDEAVKALVKDKSGLYVDGTFGRGGHSQQILDALCSDGKLLALDKDPEAVSFGKKIKNADGRFDIIHTGFGAIRDFAGRESVDGLLLDLGVSSPQLDSPERGFSFLQDGPLDMRMNPDTGVSAAQWVNEASLADMIKIFKEYGEERYARRIASSIIAQRACEPIVRTLQLAHIVREANPSWEKNKHPATRVFQAIRIHVNRELSELTEVLDGALDVLKPGGRLVVISFHSLEDRIVKKFIRKHEKGDPFPVKLPIRQEEIVSRIKSCGKAVRAAGSEQSGNRRSRSAIMRVAEKLV